MKASNDRSRSDVDRQIKLRLFYRDLHSELEEHPIDRLVHERVGKATNRQLAKLSSAIVKTLGAKSKLWFDYEEAKTNLCTRREEMYFDLGVEHGIATAAMDKLWGSRLAVRNLAERLVREALSSGLPCEDAASAGVLVAWALIGRLRLTKRKLQ